MPFIINFIHIQNFSRNFTVFLFILDFPSEFIYFSIIPLT